MWLHAFPRARAGLCLLPHAGGAQLAKLRTIESQAHIDVLMFVTVVVQTGQCPGSGVGVCTGGFASSPELTPCCFHRHTQEARSWSNTGTTSNGPDKKAGEAELDFSATKGDGKGGGASPPLDLGASLVDAPADDYPSDSDEDDADVRSALSHLTPMW